jgi:tRNA(Ile)-lysidine synthase
MMNLEVKPGKYILAVSGGIDSMALLNMLSEKSDIELIVAHFDHGIRADSYKDRQLVERTTLKLGLRYEYAVAALGPHASEENARKLRYDFLMSIRNKYNAEAIITAHHLDDVIETAFINLLRGTGRMGLTSLKSTNEIIRPLLRLSKADLRAYASDRSLEWREDITNKDTKYLRNYIRTLVMPKLSQDQKQLLVTQLERLRSINNEIDLQIAYYLQLQNPEVILKYQLGQLDHAESCEVMAGWLRINGIIEFNRKTIERLVIAAKTRPIGASININKRNYLQILHTSLAISSV